MIALLRDIRSGALPLSEVPGFVVWLLAKSFWFWFLIVVIGVVLIVVK